MPRTPSQMDSKMSVEKVTTNLRYLRPDPRPDLDGSGEGDQLEDNNRDAEIVVVGRLLLLLLCLLPLVFGTNALWTVLVVITGALVLRELLQMFASLKR